MVDEEGIDEVAHGQEAFARQLTEPRMSAQAAGTVKRITGVRLERHGLIPRSGEASCASGFRRLEGRVVEKMRRGCWSRDRLTPRRIHRSIRDG